MPSKDTIPFHLTKKTEQEIERIRVVMSKELGIDIKSITKKHGEIALREKSKKGKLFLRELNDILLGKTR